MSSLTEPAPSNVPPSSVSAILALVLATSAWSSLFFVGRDVVRVLDPLWFTTLRYGLASLILLPLLLRNRRVPWSTVLQHFNKLSVFGLLGYGVFSVLVFYGLARSEPSHGAVIMATMPLTTMLVQWLRGGQRPASTALVAAMVALIGVATVAGLLGSHQESRPSAVIGDLVTLLGTLGWVAYTRGAATVPNLSALEYTALTALASAPLMLLGAVGLSVLNILPPPDPVTLRALAPKLLYVALLPTVCAALAFNFGVRCLGPAIGTMFLNLVPLGALAISTAMGQPPSPHELVGAALVMAALALATRAPMSRA